ncbi:hypothetical protein PMAYCL1PPCAC_01855, partial [Pristionchus mayeri]
ATDLYLSVSITLPRSFFSLASIIDLKAPVVTAPSGARVAVEAILCGMRPSGWDWEITSGAVLACRQSDPTPIYYVHKEKFTTFSFAIH